MCIRDRYYLSPSLLGAGIGHKRLGRCRVGSRGTDHCRRNPFHCLVAVVICDQRADRDRGIDFVVQVSSVQSGEGLGTHVRLEERYHECTDLRVVDFLYRGIHPRYELESIAPDDRGGIRDRLFFRATAVIANLSFAACRFVAYSDILAFGGYFHLFVCCPDAGNGISALFLAAHAGKERGRYRNIAYPLALGHHDSGSFGGKTDRTGSCRAVGRNRFVDIRGRLVFVGSFGG